MIKESILKSIREIRDYYKFSKLYNKYCDFTMIPKTEFVQNLSLIERYNNTDGVIVECGVWRGGFSAAMADLLGKERQYFLFDSFEGLPQAKNIDGQAAIDWQNNKSSETYFENCKAEIEWAKKAISKSKAQKFEIKKGWFKDTLPEVNKDIKISVLRLDGDWYESTIDCLTYLYPLVVPGGLIILDDYFLWDGCARAVHDYISKHSLPIRIKQFNDGNVFYLIKP